MTSGLVNALIQRKNGTGLRRVVRDDGLKGLQISNPNDVAEMRPISLDEFQSEWVIVKSAEEQRAGDINLTIHGTEVAPSKSVNMDTSSTTNTFTSEVTPMAEEPRLNEAPFAGRAEDTDREAMKEEILSKPLIDAQSDGQPVAANEDPNSTLEEDRMNPEADENAPTGDPEAQAEADAMTPAADENAAGDEPLAANEDPTPEAQKPKRRSTKKA